MKWKENEFGEQQMDIIKGKHCTGENHKGNVVIQGCRTVLGSFNLSTTI